MEDDVPLGDLAAAPEVLLTSSTRDVQHVSEADGRELAERRWARRPTCSPGGRPTDPEPTVIRRLIVQWPPRRVAPAG